MPSIESRRGRIRVLEAMLAALDQWDAISSALVECPTRTEALEVLTDGFGFGEDTRQHVLEMQVSNLTRTFRDDVLAELAEHRDAVEKDGDR